MEKREAAAAAAAAAAAYASGSDLDGIEKVSVSAGALSGSVDGVIARGGNAAAGNSNVR